MKKNEDVLNDLQGEFQTVEAYDKTPTICKYLLALIEAVKNQRQRKTDDLATLVELKIGAQYVSDEQAGSKALRLSYDTKTKFLDSY